LATQDVRKYFSRKIFFKPFQVPMELERIEKMFLLPLLKRKGKLST